MTTCLACGEEITDEDAKLMHLRLPKSDPMEAAFRRLNRDNYFSPAEFKTTGLNYGRGNDILP